MLDQIEKPTTLARLVGLNMRKWRKERDLTLQKVSALCETTPQTIQRLEMGGITQSVEWVERISKALGVKPHILFMADTDDLTLLEKTETRLRKAELAFQMLRAAVDTICREQLD